MSWILETKIGYWEHKTALGNITCILETQVLYLKHGIVYWKHKNYKRNNKGAFWVKVQLGLGCNQG